MSLPTPKNKYHRLIVGTADENGELGAVMVDVYRVLEAYQVTCPALQHLVKKALCVGLRGHKDVAQDLQDTIDSAVEAQRLHREREYLSNTTAEKINAMAVELGATAPFKIDKDQVVFQHKVNVAAEHAAQLEDPIELPAPVSAT